MLGDLTLHHSVVGGARGITAEPQGVLWSSRVGFTWTSVWGVTEPQDIIFCSLVTFSLRPKVLKPRLAYAETMRADRSLL